MTKKEKATIVTKIETAEANLRRDLQETELRLKIFLGVILAAGLGLLGTLMKLL